MWEKKKYVELVLLVVNTKNEHMFSFGLVKKHLIIIFNFNPFICLKIEIYELDKHTTNTLLKQ